MLSQVLAVFTIAELLERVVYRAVTVPVIERTILILVLVVIIRFVCERMGARSSYLACVDVKRILREKIYDKMLKLGASYSEQVSSSEVVQVSTEGVEQLETYLENTFRRITMKVLTMQLNSTSVMDIVAYGGAAIGMAVAVSEFLTKVSKNSPSSTGGSLNEKVNSTF